MMWVVFVVSILSALILYSAVLNSSRREERDAELFLRWVNEHKSQKK